MPSNLVPTSPVAYFSFNSGYFNSATDGWGVGTDGVILHFDGSNYGTVTSPTINNFTSVSFGPPLTGPMNPNDGWAVGNSSYTRHYEPTIYHWNGFVWTKGVSIGTLNNLNSVFMVNSWRCLDSWRRDSLNSFMFSGTARPTLCPVILHFTGGSWNTITPPPGSYSLNSIFMVSSQLRVGRSVTVRQYRNAGIILHYTEYWRRRDMGHVPSTINPSSDTWTQFGLHAQPERRLGGWEKRDDTSLHCEWGNRDVECGHSKWVPRSISRCNLKLNLHAKSNEWLGSWRHLSSRSH